MHKDLMENRLGEIEDLKAELRMIHDKHTKEINELKFIYEKGILKINMF